MSIKRTVQRMGAPTALFLLLSAGWVCAEMRMWTDKDGKSVYAEFKQELFGKIFLKDAESRTVLLAVADLSETDLNYFQAMIPPNVEVEFSKITRLKERSIYAREDDKIGFVTVTVEITKERKSLSRGTLHGELYLVGEEIATDDYRMLAKKRFPVRFEGKKGNLFVYETSVEERNYREYNDQVRGTEYSGYMLVLIDSQDEVFHISTNLDWLDEESIPLFRALSERSFFNDYCWEVPVPRPDCYTSQYRW